MNTDVKFLLLNPSPFPILDSNALNDIQNKTFRNCVERTKRFRPDKEINEIYGNLSNADSNEIQYRVKIIEREIKVWRELQKIYPNGFIEICDWKFSEYVLFNNQELNEKAKECIMGSDEVLKNFFL